MQIISMLCVRDEEDVIQKCLEHRLEWADQVFVFDTGSSDGTWEIACDMALGEKRIVPVCQDSVCFSDTLVRGWLFDKVRNQLRDGDWFSRCDADEIYHISPRVFIDKHLRSCESSIYHEHLNFVIRDTDVDQWENDSGFQIVEADDIEERLRWYWIHGYSEPRLARYRTTMKWPRSVSFPRFAGLVAKERIPIRHYPHRSLKQIKKRILLRTVMLERGKQSGAWNPELVHHWVRDDWRDFVFQSDNPKLSKWEMGEKIGEIPSFNPDKSWVMRQFYRAFYKWGVGFADYFVGGWSSGDYPEKIDAALQEKLDAVFRIPE